MENSCKELFLDDIVKVQFYPVGAIKSSVPRTIPSIVSLGITLPSQPSMSISYTDDDNIARENSITVSQNSERKGCIIYKYGVSAVLDAYKEDYQRTFRELMNDDHDVVLTKSDGTSVLLFALPGSFSFSYTDTMKDVSIKVSLSSYSSFIKISET